ncbi:putative ribonuclease H-like domain-containing protein, partial [Tanacetum coccineum]
YGLQRKTTCSLDKSKIECYNCHRKGHFARECRSGRNQGRRSYGDNDRSNAPTTESSSQALVAQDGLGGYDWSNDFEVEPVNYALMAISSLISSSSSVSEIALKSLEARILGHEKNKLAWGEKYEFQNYELKCREIKINNLNLELEKVVKERDELKDKIEKWEESSENLNEILNSQMNARDKTGLGYSTQLNELSSNHETDSENSLSIFNARSSDEDNTPENDKFLKNGYKAVPPPITGNFLTPRADISFAGKTVGKTNDANIEKPKSVSESVVSNPKINRYNVIIEDWNSDDEEEGTARPSISTARPVCTARLSISTARTVCTARPSISTARPVYASRPIYPRMDNVRPRGLCSPIKRSYYTKPTFRPKDLKQDVKTFGVQNMTAAGIRAVVNTGKGKLNTDLKRSRWSNPEILLQDHAVMDSGCSSHMAGNKAYLSDYEDFNGGFVAFGSDPKGDELKFNLFSVLQKCDKKNSVLFTEFECLILSPSFKLLDESQVVLRAPRKDDIPWANLMENLMKVICLDTLPLVKPLEYTTKGPKGNSMNYIPVSVENHVNMDAGTQDSYIAGSSGKDKGPTQEYILLPLQPHRTRIPVKDVV